MLNSQYSYDIYKNEELERREKAKRLFGRKKEAPDRKKRKR